MPLIVVRYGAQAPAPRWRRCRSPGTRESAIAASCPAGRPRRSRRRGCWPSTPRRPRPPRSAVKRGRRRPEGERLRLRLTAGGDRRLQIDHGQVGGRQPGRSHPECGARVGGQPVGGPFGEVDVTGEGDGERLAARDRTRALLGSGCGAGGCRLPCCTGCSAAPRIRFGRAQRLRNAGDRIDVVGGPMPARAVTAPSTADGPAHAASAGPAPRLPRRATRILTRRTGTDMPATLPRSRPRVTGDARTGSISARAQPEVRSPPVWGMPIPVSIAALWEPDRPATAGESPSGVASPSRAHRAAATRAG